VKVARAKRRWLAWCRYVDKTQSQANRSARWGYQTHQGQSKAWNNYMFAHRWPPRGCRYVPVPRWGFVR
jgi:hypothetical protein